MEWHKLLEEEAEEWRFLLEEEFGPMKDIEQAWQELQRVPSYAERYAKAPYMTELAFRLKLGNAFFYYHQECGVPSHRYTNVGRADMADGAICMGCHGLLSEAPVLE